MTAAQTILVELWSPSRAKQEIFRRLQREIRRLPAVVFSASAWSLTVADGRWKLIIPLLGRTVALPILVPPAQAAILQQLLVHGLPLEGRLFDRCGRWFFAARYLNAALPAPDAIAIGVDLGKAMRAVAYEPVQGRRLFISGRRDRVIEANYLRKICQLQQKGARRTVKRLAAKLERFRCQSDREVAIALVRFARSFARPILKFEAAYSPSKYQKGEYFTKDEEVRRFRRIIRMVARRAEPAKIAVAAVTDRYSSLRCSSCGTLATGQRKGTKFACSCGFRAHADLNAARNLAQTAIWQGTLQFAPARYNPGGQADGTAISPSWSRYKGETMLGGSACQQAHAADNTTSTLAATNSCKEEHQMASIVKDLTESTSNFMIGTLDNVKSYVDKTSEELSKVDVINVTRHILDTALDGAKNVVKSAAEPSGLDTFGKLRAFADGSLEATRQVVNVIAEEGKKADVFGLTTRLTLEGLNAIRAEVDLGIETSKSLANRLAPLATSAKPVITRPPQVTRVEIEHEKPAKSSTKSPS
ncbi:MAG: transposase [Cyanobacteria bacterium NC_groundwater_1444_Ag_S-0.65um_54_12]|nr:transposase [Cyanobacteria bacterium NC_groundwater_1444_Ag_S-0.65um_54_12]